jgi:hypothetical protein
MGAYVIWSQAARAVDPNYVHPPLFEHCEWTGYENLKQDIRATFLKFRTRMHSESYGIGFLDQKCRRPSRYFGDLHLNHE